MAQFVWRLVEASHAQWLYQNLSLHYYAKGYLCQQTESTIRREVKLLAVKRPIDLPQECRYLLELPQRPSQTSSAAHNTYWILLVMKAAKTSVWNLHK
jgi:hypothetical protein